MYKIKATRLGQLQHFLPKKGLKKSPFELGEYLTKAGKNPIKNSTVPVIKAMEVVAFAPASIKPLNYIMPRVPITKTTAEEFAKLGQNLRLGRLDIHNMRLTRTGITPERIKEAKRLWNHGKGVVAMEVFADDIDDEGETLLPGAPMSNVTLNAGGNYLSSISRNSPILNQKIRISVVAKDASAAQKLAYEFKRAGVGIIGIAQTGGKVILDVTAVATSVLITCLLFNKLVEEVKPQGGKAAGTVMEALKKLVSKFPKFKYIKWVGVGLAGVLGTLYVRSRMDYYKNNSNPTQQINKYKYNNPAF